MTKRNSTKKAVITSVLSLLLCMTMLVGSTFAWFTDSASTGVNTIVSGNLDIVLYKGNVNEANNAIVYDTDEVSAATKLFKENTLWEPGYAEVAYLKVANEGNLALKYALSVAFSNEKAGTNVDGESYKLSEVLKYAVVEIGAQDFYADRTGALNAIADIQGNLVNQTISSYLTKQNDAKYYAIVVYMPEATDNKANPKPGTEAPSIDIGVSLVATQYNAEVDGFDKDYDKGATYAVNNVEDLKNAFEDAKDGDVIILGDNIALDEMVQTGNKELTIDLAGKELELGNATERKDGLVVSEGATLNLVNSNSEKTVIEYQGTHSSYDAIYVAENSTLNIGGNIDVVVSPEASSAIHATAGSTVNIGKGTNIVIKGETDNQFAAVFIERGATVNMTGGVITIESNLTIEDDGWNNDAVGVVLRGKDAAFRMTGGTINVHSKNAQAQGIQICTENGVGECYVNIEGGTINVTNVGEQGGSYAFAFYDTRVGEIQVTGGNFTGAYNALVMGPAIGAAEDANINITGGTFAIDPSHYVEDGSEVTNNGNGTYSVKQVFTAEGNEVTLLDPTAMDSAFAYIENEGTIKLSAGTYTLPLNSNALSNKNITLVGQEGTVIDVSSLVGVNGVNDWYGTTVTFENLTVNWNTHNEGYQGIKNPAKVIYRNCTINGTQFMYSGADFIGCTFVTGNSYAVYTRASGNYTFTDCNFITGGRAIMMYCDGVIKVDITLTNCTFSDDGTYNSKDKAAVETGDFGAACEYNITLNDCTITKGFETNNSTSALWGNKDNMPNTRLNVVIGEEDVY